MPEFIRLGSLVLYLGPMRGDSSGCCCPEWCARRLFWRLFWIDIRRPKHS